MNFWVEVRRHVLVEGHSKRSACRAFGLNFRTVQKILDHAQPPGYRRQAARPARKIDQVLPLLEAMLESDRTAPAKQRHTAKRIHDRLRDEHGFDGGLTIVKDAVRSWRKVRAQTYVPLSHPPGEAQVDFGEASFYLDGVLTKAALFVMSLPYSDAVFIRAYPRECTESFQDGHVQAFAFFGGVPTRISYDNSRIAVKKLVGPRARELVDGFLRLQSHYLFKEHFCLVRQANEKGHVENLVGYTRRNFLVPLPSVRSFEELNEQLVGRCHAELDRQLRGRNATKRHLLEVERGAFRALPSQAFTACRVERCQANTLSLVRFDRNDYSVPVQWAHHEITIIGDCRQVRMMCRDQIVATHPRDWGREQVRYDPVHYLALLERRPGALDFAAPLKDWELPPCLGILRRKLEADRPSDSGRGSSGDGTHGDVNGTRQFIQVLRLLEHATLSELKAAVEQALELGTVTPDAVKVILEGRRERPPAVFNLAGRPHLSRVYVAPPDLGAYAVLLPSTREPCVIPPEPACGMSSARACEAATGMTCQVTLGVASGATSGVTSG
ncbi:MAG: IS21 family transposase, partial [Halothiobacillaceae bacterium]